MARIGFTLNRAMRRISPATAINVNSDKLVSWLKPEMVPNACGCCCARGRALSVQAVQKAFGGDGGQKAMHPRVKSQVAEVNRKLRRRRDLSQGTHRPRHSPTKISPNLLRYI